MERMLPLSRMHGADREAEHPLSVQTACKEASPLVYARSEVHPPQCLGPCLPACVWWRMRNTGPQEGRITQFATGDLQSISRMNQYSTTMAGDGSRLLSSKLNLNDLNTPVTIYLLRGPIYCIYSILTVLCNESQDYQMGRWAYIIWAVKQHFHSTQ